MTRWLRLRWAVDRGAAVVLGVLTAPLAALVWAVVRVVDGPPAVVRLPRIGRDGVEFAMGKFRSMTVQSASGHAGGAALTVGADPRVTPLGRRLRHYRLDELPQLGNVIRGESPVVLAIDVGFSPSSTIATSAAMVNPSASIWWTALP